MENLHDILFYSLEKSIKTYRQFAQRQLVQQGFNITIDQWLVLKALNENIGQTQQQIAVSVFKDYASVTRMIDLLVEKHYLVRTQHVNDRRRFSIKLTEEAISMLEAMQPVIEKNRSIALTGLSQQQASQFQDVLNLIINNCQP